MCFLTVNLSHFKLEWLIARELCTFMSHSSFQSQIQDTKHDQKLLFLGREAFLEQQWQEYLMRKYCKNRLAYSFFFFFFASHTFSPLFLSMSCMFLFLKRCMNELSMPLALPDVTSGTELSLEESHLVTR